MKTFILVIQIVSAVLLSLAILVQNRGAGLSITFGGSSGNFYASKRGAEKIFHQATIVLAFIFFGSAFAYHFVY